VIGVLLAGVSPSAAQQVSEARLKELMAQAQQLVGSQLPAPVQDASQAGSRPVINLTMDDAVRMTLDQNIDISVQRLNPQIQDFSLAQVRAAYRPTASATFGDQSSRSAGTSQISGGAVIDTGRYTWNMGVSQAIPWTGATTSVNFNNNRQDSTSNNATINPNYTANLQFSATQPLLRNRSIDPTGSRSRRRRSRAAWRMSP
jgi:hypothetical protein